MWHLLDLDLVQLVDQYWDLRCLFDGLEQDKEENRWRRVERFSHQVNKASK